MLSRLSPPSQTLDIPKDRLLTTKEAADYLGVTSNTLEIWRCTKRYPIDFIRVGRLVKYRQSVLEAFLKQQTVVAE